MKKIFILAFSILYFTPLFSQVFLEEGKVWNFLLSSGEEASLKFEEDTIIGDFSFKKTWFRDSLTGNWNFSNAYIREDIEEKKVYWRDESDWDVDEFVMYDFSKEAGDWFEPRLGWYCSFDVIATDSITISNGEKRKRLLLRQPTHPWVEDICVVEGIGAVNFGTYNYLFSCNSSFESDFTSCTINGIEIYSSNENSCNLDVNPDAVTELKENKDILINPNPAFNLIKIESNLALKHLQIYNINGQLIKESNLSSSNNSIDLTALPKGLFIFKIKLEDGSLFSKKVVRN